ncbi:MAG: DnaJ domain-containing protein [Myxococcaceae bacterium]|jgi:hypothetical protein|nr:DnaJ domain-containing protein [Myxococcaceae bacterium]
MAPRVLAPPVVSSPSAAPNVLVPPAAPSTGSSASGLAPVASSGSVLVPPAPPVSRPSGLATTPTGTSAVTAPARPSPLPATGAVETVTPQMAQQLALIADALDGQDYFQLLQVPQTASAAEIKRAFYRDSRVYHPDRVFHLTDAKVKGDIGAIYKRITEAYYVLRDDAKRKKYLVDITGPERATRLRYTEATEAELKAEAKKVVEEEFGTTPKGRQFFKTALQEIDRQQWQAAERSLKSALMYESGNAKFKEKLALVQTKLEDQRKLSGDSFRIK